MDKDYFKELYEAKKELLRCYNWMLEVIEKVECFPKEEVIKSKRDIEGDLEAMKVDLEDDAPQRNGEQDEK